ncbi:hypothetical protein SND67_03745, partial [Escherichia coli]|nr:hypothetical protein [Escherichia coli]
QSHRALSEHKTLSISWSHYPISLTVPVVTLIAFMTGNELQFALGAPEMVVMVASLVLCHISFSTGRTNVLNGAAHLALFAAYLMTIFA